MSHSAGQGSGYGNGYDHGYNDGQSPTYAHQPSIGTTPTSTTSTQYRPATIAELAERASLNLWDDSASSTKDFKAYLRLAERYRKEGKDAAKKGDYEHAFVMLAKAATLVLEKLPGHRDYQTVLTASQRSNLSLVRCSAKLSGSWVADRFNLSIERTRHHRPITRTQEYTGRPLREMATKAP